MSRSARKTPIFGNTNASSEATDKRIWHKRLRANDRTALAVAGPDSEFEGTHVLEVSNAWAFAKDGKSYMAPARLTRWAQRSAGTARDPGEQAAMLRRARAKQMAK